MFTMKIKRRKVGGSLYQVGDYIRINTDPNLWDNTETYVIYRVVDFSGPEHDDVEFNFIYFCLGTNCGCDETEIVGKAGPMDTALYNQKWLGTDRANNEENIKKANKDYEKTS